MPKIKVTSEVRKLLVELDHLMQTFHSQTGTLADRDTPDTVAADVGAKREYTRGAIVCCAYRINRASRGEA